MTYNLGYKNTTHHTNEGESILQYKEVKHPILYYTFLSIYTYVKT